MTHDLLVWLLDLIRQGADPIRTASQASDEAIEIVAWGRRFLIRVTEVAP